MYKTANDKNVLRRYTMLFLMFVYSHYIFLCQIPTQVLFFSNSDRDFYSENNNVLQVNTYISTKKTKKSRQRKHYYLLRLNSKYFHSLALKPLGLYVIFIRPFCSLFTII
jgi:hypothetical protein